MASHHKFLSRGAEGTIVEGGQENLPRIIWGLEGEDTGRSRSEIPKRHTKNSNLSPASQGSRKPSTRNTQSRVSPRYEKTLHARLEVQQMHQAADSRPRPLVPATHVEEINATVEYDYVVPAHGLIDLNQLARPRSAMGLSPVYSDQDLSSNRAYGTADLRTHGIYDDVDLDWKAYSVAQESLRHSMLSPQASAFNGLGGFIRPSGSSFSASSLASSQSPIQVDISSRLRQASQNSGATYSPLSTSSTPLHTPATVHSANPRMSALEIAQKYRQHQIQIQPQAMLPTPPNSSSPIWSAKFSPYQGSLLSPAGLAINPWSSAPPPAPSTQNSRLMQQSQQANSPSATRILAQGYPSTISFAERPGPRQANNRPVPLGMSTTRPPDHVFSSSAIDLALLHSARVAAPVERRKNRATPRVADPQASPTAPRPPPNTPLQRATTRAHAKPANSINELFAPLSPTSPDPASLSATHRSLPLHRLIQRRLSCVPEEESGTLPDKDRVVPMPEPDRRRASYTSAEGKTLSQSSSARGPRFTQRPLGVPMTVFGDGPSKLAKQPAGRSVTMPNMRPGRATGEVPRPAEPQRMNEGDPRHLEHVEQSPKPRPRGRNGKKGRQPNSAMPNGPERIDGGLTVRS